MADLLHHKAVGEHQEILRLRNGFYLVFGTLWPALGANRGYFAGMRLRSLLSDRAERPLPTPLYPFGSDQDEMTTIDQLLT